MANRDPRQEIINHLITLKMPESEVSASFDHSRQITSSTEERELTRTFRFLKERNIASYRLSLVAMTDVPGRETLFTTYLAQDKKGNWHLHDSMGHGSKHNVLEHDQPWVNLGGGGWPDHFFVSGYVSGCDHQDIQRVCLTSANGVILEDTVEHGLVLFVTDQKVDAPFQADLYNHDDELVGSHEAFSKRKI